MVQKAIEAKVQLGQMLLAKGLIDQAKLDQSLAEQQNGGHRQLLGEILVQKGYCTEREVAVALAESYGIPYVELTPRICDPKVMEVLPRHFCQELLVLPMFRVHNTLTVAVSDPANLFLTDQIEHLTGYRVQVVCTTAGDIQATLRAYSPSAGVFALEDRLPSDSSMDLTVVRPGMDTAPTEGAAAGTSGRTDEQPAVMELLNYLLTDAASQRATHIYIEPQEQSLRVRFRIGGALVEKARPPVQMHAPLVARLKAMAGLDPSAAYPQEAIIRVVLGGRPMDLRVLAIRSVWGQTVVVEIMPEDRRITTLESLGFTIDNLQRLRQVIRARSGLVLVCGPPGSGRKTTARAICSELCGKESNVCTVEDPVECFVPGLNQFQADGRGSRDLLGTFRYVLRLEPDVVMVSDLNEPALARSAAYAAAGGRLVIAVVDALSADSAVIGLLQMGVPGPLLGQWLAGVLAQRLVGRICSNCRQPYEPAGELRQLATAAGQEIPVYYRGEGCTHCRQTGLVGRMGLHELLVPGPGLREILRRTEGLERMRQVAVQEGMVPMHLDAMEKVRAGIVCIDNVAWCIRMDIAGS